MTFPENFIPESALICLLVRKFASFQEQGKRLFTLSHVSVGGIQEKRNNVYTFDKLNQLKQVKIERLIKAFRLGPSYLNYLYLLRIFIFFCLYLY